MVSNRITALVILGVVGLGVFGLVVVRRNGAGASAPASGVAADVATDTGEKATIELLKEPMTLPPFSLKDLDGRTLSSADWKGKVVVVNFWATWCGPCRAEVPDLVALQDKYRDQLIVVGVSEDEGPVEGVRAFASQYKVNYPIAMTTPEMEKLFPGIVALPTTFVLDKDGRVVQKHVGMLHARDTEATARHLAGLQVNAEVKRVDDPSKVDADAVAQMKEIPGVDLSKVPEARRADVMQALNKDSCTCGCGLTVAKCRIDDPTCSVSQPLAKAIVDRVLAAGQ